VPLAEVQRYAIDLKSKTQGKGTFTMEFSHYEEVPAQLAEKIIALAKKTLQNYARLDLIQALDHEQIAQEICRKTEDRVEGMKSFVEKRAPVFKGK
jgi:translation elongation factor EF-G